MKKQVPLRCEGCNQIVGTANVEHDDAADLTSYFNGGDMDGDGDIVIEVDGAMSLEKHLPECPFLQNMIENGFTTAGLSFEGGM